MRENAGQCQKEYNVDSEKLYSQASSSFRAERDERVEQKGGIEGGGEGQSETKETGSDMGNSEYCTTTGPEHGGKLEVRRKVKKGVAT